MNGDRPRQLDSAHAVSNARTRRTYKQRDVFALNVPAVRKPPAANPDQSRMEFAQLVVRQLSNPAARIAVVDCDGRPGYVDTREPLYDIWQRDHALVGVYKQGAAIREVVEDLKAAGL